MQYKAEMIPYILELIDEYAQKIANTENEYIGLLSDLIQSEYLG